jgi:hypothetical protein
MPTGCQGWLLLRRWLPDVPRYSCRGLGSSGQ